MEGKVLGATDVINAVNYRQSRSLGQSEQRISLATDKFAHDIRKDSQLSGKQIEDITSLDHTLGSIGRIDGLFKDAKTGIIIGKAQTVAQLAGLAPPVFTKLKVESDNMLANYVKYISGAQVSDREREMFEAMMPRVDDHPNTFRAKLDQFKVMTESHREDFIRAIKTGQPLKEGTLKDLEKASAPFMTEYRSSKSKNKASDKASSYKEAIQNASSLEEIEQIKKQYGAR